MTLQLLALLRLFSLAAAVNLTGYEYVVVGSGAGGGPLAARLALAGHKTLLIEAGDDQGDTYNYTVPAFSPKTSEDATMSWNFFVRHYADDKQQACDYKTTYTTPDGGEYTGLNPQQARRSRARCILAPVLSAAALRTTSSSRSTRTGPTLTTSRL